MEWDPNDYPPTTESNTPLSEADVRFYEYIQRTAPHCSVLYREVSNYLRKNEDLLAAER